MGKDKKNTALNKNRTSKNRFENWYFKLVDAKEENVLGILVEVQMTEQGTEAFLQVVGNQINENICVSYPLESVQSKDTEIQIGENHLGLQQMTLNIQKGDFTLKGEISFSGHKPLKQSLWIPGLMGPYKYLPFLESYHEVLSLQHTLMGSLWLNEKQITFNEGKGYIEKDWGKAFPNVWLWAQCNHFKRKDVALMIGIARLPIFFDYYTSFAIPIYYNDQLEIFSNYNGGHIAKLYRYKGYVHLIVTQKNKILDIKIYGSDEVSCVTSRSSHMIRDVYACDTAKIEFSITENGNVIFEEVSTLCELEMGGNTSKLK
ncbi:MAG: tocopherol cyclase family protein [Candidatus Cellulosilyticum pullistercoris]|uniref:Tocopherol cyclase family protein n=1 Tax=Candidatus Cellulosilyticum pullistercoris TaxID=2838521 RepID=A0A9E2KEK6_9FIRM|nr:tocopherol cyclase family protein [Candidatus Cellulosilyticum pullistercoris]